ncbi:DUF4747 family protein [Alcaligenes aquatilis]|uniref:DUF4747 family protein n=1 Tax=Alcaligenes aquatilis TaxID=323284 RepID=UPI0036153B32
MHPHPPGSYIELLNMARRTKGSVVLYGKSCARIGVFEPLDEEDPKGIHYGEIHRYINIDALGDWYDTDQGKKADEDDVKKVIIPKNLKPEYEPFRFVFFPKEHRLFFESKAYKVGPLTPAHVQKLLISLFKNQRILNKFGQVEVTVEPAADTVDRIFSIPILRKLKIEVTRPNTDDFSEYEKEVFDRLQDESAQSVQEIMVAQHNSRLTPTNRTKALCKVAASNGQAEGFGKDVNGRAVHVSTSDYPWTEKKEFRPTEISERNAFLDKSREMLDKLMRRLRNDKRQRQT